ncbi:hypothetical protein Misp01_19600 [Microtetraspora sp. NBRC 13810]|nr:hypothetical protein Misp01_19600 [Microtetraspora sp. NBRC 13810]
MECAGAGRIGRRRGAGLPDAGRYFAVGVLAGTVGFGFRAGASAVGQGAVEEGEQTVPVAL